MNLEKLMHRHAYTCQPDDSLLYAARVMWEHDIGSLPVVDSDRRAVGMITDRDIAMSAYHTGLPLQDAVVRGAMSRVLYSAGPEESLEAVEARMRQHQVHRMPVVNRNQEVIGVVSLNDIARAAVEASPKAEEPGLDPAVVTTTLASIAHPRVAAMVTPS